MDKALLVAALAVCVLPACRASVNVNAKASTEEPAEEGTGESAPAAPAPPAPSVVLNTAYFGVARSLTLKPGNRTPPCTCVDAAVGTARDPAFDWHGDAPAVGSDGLVVAIGSEGVQCDSPGRGPSVAGIDRVGNDVVVVLEEFKETRPLALGAIIPNPGAGGRVYLRARGKIPYGRPLAGSSSPRKDLCLIGQGTEGPESSPPEEDLNQ